MVLEKLSISLKESLKKLANAVFVDDSTLNTLIKDIQRALLHADVNVKLVFQLSNDIKKRAREEKTPAAMTKKEHVIKIVYEELVKFLGGTESKIDINKKQKIMLVGIYGTGKTTTAGKIAKYCKNRGKKVALIATDTWRPAAYEQLKTLGKEIDVPVFGNKKEKDPLNILKEYEKELERYDIQIIDTAGRDALSQELIEEIERLYKYIKPTENLLVIAADIGQAAQKLAEQFHESCHITGVITTKMDGTAKAGGALTASAATGAPVKFIGVGEKIDALEEFYPERFVSRMLGMGDLETLLEKARLAIDEDKAQDLGKKFLKGDFNFLDLYEQLTAMKKMGSLSKIVEMIPGFGSAIPKEMLEGQEEKVEKWKYLLQSCTKEELENPDIITIKRIERIAKGSGCSVQDVRDLLKQYRQSKKAFKMLKGKDPEKLMKKMKIPGLKM